MKCLKTIVIVLSIVLHNACGLTYFCEDLKTGIEIFSEKCSLLTPRLARKSFEFDDYFDNPECTSEFFFTQNANSCIQTKDITVKPNSVLIIHLNVKAPVESSVLTISFLDNNNNNNNQINETNLMLKDIIDWKYWKITISDFTSERDFKVYKY